MSDRIPCINQRCRRTAPASKYEPDTEIVCGKCWRTLPLLIRQTDRSLNKRLRSMKRLAIKPDRADQAQRLIAVIEEDLHRNWEKMRDYFRVPDMPEGLDAFLAEVGL
ncbi:MAG: hypothetical protein KF810_02845 [Rhizobiaceae bacterium]|nr:hypothetical protein [Rhizobiaceae bacterium]